MMPSPFPPDPRQATRGRALVRAGLLCLVATCLLMLAMLPPVPQAPQPAPDALLEAARGETGLLPPWTLSPASAPQDGWEAVTLPDTWSRRWPLHDGVVWYRLRFTVPDAGPGGATPAPQALLLDAVNMAGAAWLDAQLLWRDSQLGEPGLTRAWNQSRFVRLPALEPGSAHELVLRVSGYADYAGGVGDIRIGDADVLQQLHEGIQWWRVGLQQLSLGVNLAIGLLFLMLWLCWPRERLYGWFALTDLAWTACSYNHIATSVWPLADTAQWQAAVAQMLLLFGCAYMVFVVRFTGRRHPRAERLVLALFLLAGGASLAGLAWWPGLVAPVRMASILLGSALFYGSAAYVACHAWSTREPMSIMLALALMLPLVAGLHDLGVLLTLIDDTRYLTLASSTLMLMSMAFIMAWRLRSAFEREAYFNQDLREHVEAARQELATALARQRELEVSSARYSERLRMVRDLHDGLGGTLVHAILRWKQAPAQPLQPQQALSVVEQIRDDLRLIIDSTGQSGELDFSDMMASLRHRWVPHLQSLGMAVEWDTAGGQALALQGTRALNVLRLLQEALANVARHSGARSVQVRLDGGPAGLVLQVRDDGRGFDAQARQGQGATSMGLSNMQHRAQALQAQFTQESAPGQGSRIVLRMPLVAGELR